MLVVEVVMLIVRKNAMWPRAYINNKNRSQAWVFPRHPYQSPVIPALSYLGVLVLFWYSMIILHWIGR